MRQATLKDSFSLDGVGVHRGKVCSVTVKPADQDTGIIFFRSDKGGSGFQNEKIVASYDNVENATMCTQISNENGASLKTIEHLMAALYGMKVSNAIIEVQGEEIPILDGSSLRFVEQISRVGIKRQMRSRKILKVLKKIKVTDGDKFEEIEPFDGVEINAKCDFEAKGLKTDPVTFNFSKNNFVSKIAPARTFGFVSEAEYVKKHNLALGASLKNTVIYNDKGIPLNDDGLRFENESARHKVLDIIGDLALSQYWIQGRINCFCPSHKLNNILLRMLFASAENYEIL
ncbi:MAG: UDP-3-O-acyl-N-acetylglucosamine deacetylase [Alphaproteobacteria bacterium]|nr:UDP-3-O-[3-hydroxymyristoyl] N-acetylglucosamine deacetylase [Alphaproteobacteria bacterium]MCR4555234.1 UDP-3-O-acyl-N-acetylglucosamine deacetylase [Alphaproteobacteria bacterium]